MTNKNNNSGSCNSGDRNSGYYNSGDRNSGYYNSGAYNSGAYNSGSYNSGFYNSGAYNSGYYNSGDYNSGFFNTNCPNVRLFNKDSNIKFGSGTVAKLKSLPVKPILTWVPSGSMTEKEKIDNPTHETTGGFLRNAGCYDWSGLSTADLDFIKSLPNFDAAIFKEISGIDVNMPTCNGKTVEIDGKKYKLVEI
jgi:hypothetical protein